MRIIRVPNYTENMTVGVSLTGITMLKEGSYRQRHGGAKVVIQKPREGLILRKNDTLEIDRRFNTKKVKRKVILPNENSVIKVPKKSHYKINKKEVSHRIRQMVNQMTGEKKLFFWTISFPAQTTDDTAFLLFNKWLTRCRRDLKLKSYLWVSERQKIGTIHFHIALHQRICVKKANRFMRAGIMTCIDNNEINYTRDQAKNYNGVDIAKDRKTKKVTNFALRKKSKALINYITKYVTKNDGNFTHLAYHCSRDYSNLIIRIGFTSTEWAKIDYQKYIDFSTPFDNDWVTFYRWKSGAPPDFTNYFAYVNRTVITLVTNN